MDSLLELVAAKTQTHASQIHRASVLSLLRYTRTQLTMLQKDWLGMGSGNHTERMQSNPISQVTSDAERLPMASAGAITAERSASLGSTTWSGISAGIDGATVSASPAFSTPSSGTASSVDGWRLVGSSD